MTELNEIEQKIADMIVEAALSDRKVTFTEIMEKVGISRRKLGEYLSHIGNKCKELELPVITVIVVYKNGGKVGKGRLLAAHGLGHGLHRRVGQDVLQPGGVEWLPLLARAHQNRPKLQRLTPS